MLRHLIKISGILLLLFLVACSGNSESIEPAQSEQPEQPEQIEEAAPVQDDSSVEEEELLTVASKPQLIEFYADW